MAIKRKGSRGRGFKVSRVKKQGSKESRVLGVKGKIKSFKKLAVSSMQSTEKDFKFQTVETLKPRNLETLIPRNLDSSNP